MDFATVSADDQPDMSITLKYLLENPALLQPPECSKSEEKCKDDKVSNQGQHNDLTSAYLGPQIWSDMLLSDDLKLEPVDLDELLDTAGVDDEMSDLGLIMSGPTANNQSFKNQEPALTQPDDQSLIFYDNMPPLVAVDNPGAKPVSSPSQYFASPHHPPQHPRFDSQSMLLPQTSSSQQKLLEQQLCEQQFAIFSEILDNNQQVKTPSLHTKSRSHSLLNDVAHQQQVPAARVRQCISLDQSVVTHAEPSLVEDCLNNKDPSTSPITIRIPSPKRINYVPNTTDVIISTPATDIGEETIFDPSTRAFSEEELKPQPIIRKSRKVYVPPDNKDGKYWNRRNKNNVAAKRSREARRIKENQIAMRANFLEQENSVLKTEVAELRQELNRVMKLVKNYESRFPGIPK